jgi:hypothetical protein
MDCPIIPEFGMSWSRATASCSNTVGSAPPGVSWVSYGHGPARCYRTGFAAALAFSPHKTSPSYIKGERLNQLDADVLVRWRRYSKS